MALAFVAVAVAAVSLLATLTLLATNTQVSGLVTTERYNTTRSVASALVLAYRDTGGWAKADLSPAYFLAATDGARLEVIDGSGQAIENQSANSSQIMASMMGGMPQGSSTSTLLGKPVRDAITVDGSRVGTAVLQFPINGLSVAQERVRSTLEGTVLLGATLASLLALIVAWFVSRRITHPLATLTATVHSIELGQRDARAQQSSAPGEVGELAAAFDRMADALDHEDSLRRQLLADVAHELRTPITILQASLEQLVDGTDSLDPQRLSSLRDEVLRLGRLIQDLETLASAQSARLQLVKTPIDVATVASLTVDLLRPAFEAANVELVPRLHSAIIDGDANRISQVVMNLLTNALKVSPEHTRVTLSVEAGEGLARLEVSDEGPGIFKEEISHVFERFWRGSAGRRTSGSGIGLAVVTELVNAHGGRVDVSSEPGHGARFAVLIPLR